MRRRKSTCHSTPRHSAPRRVSRCLSCCAFRADPAKRLLVFAPQQNTAILPDAGTDALMAAERSIWEAWNAKGATRIEVLTAKEIAFVNIFGTFRANKAHLLVLTCNNTDSY